MNRLVGSLVGSLIGPIVLGLTAMSFFSGCEDAETQKFPQYSGTYRLVDVTYTNGSFKGLEMPPKLVVTHRMKPSGSSFNHFLKFDFMSDSKTQASGTFASSLESLTFRPQTYYNEESQANGVQYYSNNGNGVSVGCQTSAYVYSMHLRPQKILAPVPDKPGQTYVKTLDGFGTNPSPYLLNQAYRTHSTSGSVKGGAQVDPKNPPVGANDLSTVSLDENAVSEWNKSGSTYLVFEISKTANSDDSLCYEIQDNYYHEPLGTMTAIYAISTYEDKDLRSEDSQTLEGLSLPDKSQVAIRQFAEQVFLPKSK